MSSKSTLFLSDDHNEHIYSDGSEQFEDKDGKVQHGIVLEFSKKNIKVWLNDDEDLVIMLNNPDSEIFKHISKVLESDK